MTPIVAGRRDMIPWVRAAIAIAACYTLLSVLLGQRAKPQSFLCVFRVSGIPQYLPLLAPISRIDGTAREDLRAQMRLYRHPLILPSLFSRAKSLLFQQAILVVLHQVQRIFSMPVRNSIRLCAIQTGTQGEVEFVSSIASAPSEKK